MKIQIDVPWPKSGRSDLRSQRGDGLMSLERWREKRERRHGVACTKGKTEMSNKLIGRLMKEVIQPEQITPASLYK